MSSGTSTSTSKIATIVVLIPILIAAWFAAPWILPVWRWQNVDWDAIAKANEKDGYTRKSLEQEFDLIVFYNPRGGRGSKDPCPFQILQSTPAWKSVYPNSTDEFELMVRCSLLCERDGEPISKLWIGNRPDEAVFKVKAWRFPPASFGKPKGRPVIVYQGFSLEKVELGQAINWVNAIHDWENDDTWEDRNDGWGP